MENNEGSTGVEKPLREHFEMDTDAGTTLRTFDYIAALEKYNAACLASLKELIEIVEASDSLVEPIYKSAIERAKLLTK